VSRYQKGKTNLDFPEARDSEWQWHQLEHMQVCTVLQTDSHANTPPLSFLQAGCPSCRPTNSLKALKAKKHHSQYSENRTKYFYSHLLKCYVVAVKVYSSKNPWEFFPMGIGVIPIPVCVHSHFFSFPFPSRSIIPIPMGFPCDSHSHMGITFPRSSLVCS